MLNVAMTLLEDPFQEVSNFPCFLLLLLLLLSFKLCKAKVNDSVQAVLGSLTDGTNHLAEMCGVQLYESGIDVIVQSTSVALRNFYHSWVPVLMDKSDFHFIFVIIFIQTVGDSENIRGCSGFSRSQNLHYRRNEALLIWDNGPKV